MRKGAEQNFAIEVLFDNPRTPLAPTLTKYMNAAISVQIISGFMTPQGANIIAEGIRNNPKKLKKLVIGAATKKSLMAICDLISMGVAQTAVKLHLGYSKQNISIKDVDAKGFYRPMLHSKIYLMELENGDFISFVGSNNITDYALNGKNGEMCIKITLSKKDKQLQDIVNNIDILYDEAVEYSKNLFEPFLWWVKAHYQGMSTIIFDSTGSSIRGVGLIVLTSYSELSKLKKNDILYLEGNREILSFLWKSRKKYVHLYVFENKNDVNLKNIEKAKLFTCNLEGFESDGGGKQLIAKWSISDSEGIIELHSGMAHHSGGNISQARIKITASTKKPPRKKYLFEPKEKWHQVIEQNSSCEPFVETLDKPEEELVKYHRVLLNEMSSEAINGWGVVKNFVPAKSEWSENFKNAALAMNPKSTPNGKQFFAFGFFVDEESA